MSKLTKPLALILLLCSANFGFSTENKTQDSISNHLQEQFKKYRDTNIDSSIFYAHKLIIQLDLISNDSLLMKTHQNIGTVFSYNKQLDSALYHYNIALKIAQKTKASLSMIRIITDIAFSYFDESELEKATLNFKKALNSSQKYHFSKQEAICFNQLGNIYWEQGYFQKSLRMFLKADSLIEKNNYASMKLDILLNISNIYSSNKQWNTAIKELNKILALAKTKNDIFYEILANNNIGDVYEKQKKYHKALPFYLETLRISDSINDIPGIAFANHNLGSLNYHLGNYNQAMNFLKKSTTYAERVTSKLDLVYDYEYLARIYIKTRKFNMAANYLSKAITIANELDLIKKKLDLAKVQTEYYFEIGMLNLAQKAFTEYDSLRDVFSENEKSEKIIQMQTLYETDKKEKENNLLKAQNQLSQLNLEKEIQRKNQYFISFGISIVILIIIISLLRRMSRAHKTIKDFNIKLEESNGKLKVMNSTKDKFFTIIAHDLRSPLGAILGFSDLINDEISSSKEIETVKEYNGYLNQSAHNLYSLLENLLEWAKSQLGSIKYEAIAFDLSEVIKNNIEIQKLKAKEKSIGIVSKLEANTLVTADINMINTIIRNLLSNALKFSHPHTEITISAKLDTDYIRLSIQDQGLGISMKNQEKLFNIDSNFSTVGTNKEIGTGLGLILCKEFVEKNGGTISIESEEGKGSVFTFTIPLQNS